MRLAPSTAVRGFLLALFAIIALGIDVGSTTPSPTNERTEIIKVFREAVRLNEEYKRAAQTIDPNEAYPFEYQEKRKAIEEYSEDVLDPRLDDCVKFLSSNNDLELAQEFFKLLIGLENSANEMLSYSMGTIFMENPKVILETFPKFSRDEQRYLYRKLDWGWQNVVAGVKDKPESMLEDRNKKLEELRFKVFAGKKEKGRSPISSGTAASKPRRPQADSP